MKSKKLKIIIGIVVLFVAVYGTFFAPRYYSQAGRYFLAKDGSHILVDELYRYYFMTPQEDGLFEGITLGDRIRIKTKGDAFDDKSGTNLMVYSCVKLKDGGINDIPEAALEEMIDLGLYSRK